MNPDATGDRSENFCRRRCIFRRGKDSVRCSPFQRQAARTITTAPSPESRPSTCAEQLRARESVFVRQLRSTSSARAVPRRGAIRTAQSAFATNAHQSPPLSCSLNLASRVATLFAVRSRDGGKNRRSLPRFRADVFHPVSISRLARRNPSRTLFLHRCPELE